MSRLTIPSLSVAAGLFLLALMVPGPLAHATHVQELIEQRSANTRVWEVTHLPVAGTDTVADTTRVGYIVEKGTGINHKSAAGRWERTNTDFVASERPGIVLEAAEQRAPVRLRQTGGYNVEYAVGGVGINLAVESIGYYNRKSNQYLPLHRIRRVAPQTAGDKALFREAFPGADVEYLNRGCPFRS